MLAVHIYRVCNIGESFAKIKKAKSTLIYSLEGKIIVALVVVVVDSDINEYYYLFEVFNRCF